MLQWQLHHKTKTNHERFEEDRNKLAIGYRLSAIGYRLILGVLVSVFASTAFAADCKVNDSDIGNEYAGGCVNGFAHGKGKAEGRDTYEGEFKQGNKHGKGIYTWKDGGKYSGSLFEDKFHGKGTQIFSSGARYDGDFLNGQRSGYGVFLMADGREYVGNYLNDKRSGFGTFRTPKNAFSVDKNTKLGAWVGEVYVEKGYFRDGGFLFPCSSTADCKQVQVNREAQDRREAAERDEQYRRDAPARQARQMCEAQKQTCIASCPRWVNTGGYRTDFPEHSCKSRCESISCY